MTTGLKRDKLRSIHSAQEELHFQMKCGSFFREKRLLAKRQLEEVANFLRVSTQLVNDYETGIEAIPLCHVHGLSEFLHIPPQEIMELHLNLQKQLLHKPLFEREHGGGQLFGAVIREARKTLFLSAEKVAELYSQTFAPISEREILRIETDTVPPSFEFWLNFCHLLHLHTEAVRSYSRRQHLSLVNTAVKKGTHRIPVSPRLSQALQEYEFEMKTHDRKISYLLAYSLTFALDPTNAKRND